jgi:chloramphenicol 3-O phosphotransferase
MNQEPAVNREPASVGNSSPDAAVNADSDALLSPTRVVLLNGTPNAGKTTTAVALQRILPEPFLHLSLDDFITGYLPEHWNTDARALFPRLRRGYLLALRDLARAGNDLIAESVILPESTAEYLSLFREFRVYFVGIRCPLPEAQRRERFRARLGGAINLDRPGFDAVHPDTGYDLEFDSSRTSPHDAAALIADLLASPALPRAFYRLRC